MGLYVRSGVAAIVLALACGGCGTTPEPIRLGVAFDRTGSMVKGEGFELAFNRFTEFVGDVRDTEERAFVGLTLTNIPAGANVTHVTLRLSGEESSDGNAYNDFVDLRLLHIDPGAGIDASDFDSEDLEGAIVVVPRFSRAAISTVEVDITKFVKNDLAAGRTTSTFRLQFDAAPAIDGQNDVVTILADPNDEPTQPVGLVTIG